MGAMLISLAITLPVMIGMFFFTITLVAIIAFGTYRNNMNVLWWVIATVILNFWVLIPYVIARVRIALSKCPECGTRINKTHRYVCPNCYARVKKFNDKKFIQISIPLFYSISMLIALFNQYAFLFAS